MLTKMVLALPIVVLSTTFDLVSRFLKVFQALVADLQEYNMHLRINHKTSEEVLDLTEIFSFSEV